MKILSIDTSSKICSTAILEDDKIIDEINLDNGRTHSENLMPMVSEILSKNDIKLSDIDVISCSTGPGSFTGIRIGISSVKSMAEVNQIPVVGVTSLEILARIDTSDKIKVALIDARNNQVYCGIFDNQYQKKEEYIADDIMQVIEVFKKYNDIICIGDGAILHKDLIMQNIPNSTFSDANEQSAALGGKIAYKKYLNNDIKNADTIMPTYLRKSQAERMKLKK
jgi:tRNA threonylcarbamoyladenosine biosynthesis protein TsaB